jgi:hypothetical protein
VTEVAKWVAQAQITGVPEVAGMFARSPAVAYRYLRDAVGGAMGSHRREWLSSARVAFKPGGMRAGQITSRASEAAGFDAKRTMFYRVSPEAKTVQEGQQVSVDSISAESFTTSRAAAGLQTGGSFVAKGGKRSAIPIGITRDSGGRVKARWFTPKAFQRGKRKKDVIALPTKSGKGVILFWRQYSGRGKGRTSRLLPAFNLVPGVRRQARLQYYETWDRLKANRDQRFGTALEKIEKDLVHGRNA